jgi:hypothetical protein
MARAGSHGSMCVAPQLDLTDDEASIAGGLIHVRPEYWEGSTATSLTVSDLPGVQAKDDATSVLASHLECHMPGFVP